MRDDLKADTTELHRALKMAHSQLKAFLDSPEPANSIAPFSFKLRDAIRPQRPRTITRREPRK